MTAPQFPRWLARVMAWMGHTAGRVLRSVPVDALPGCLSDLPSLTREYPVLVLDSDVHTLRLLLATMQRAGLTALGVQDAALALELCRTLPVSLLVSEVTLPDRSGLLLRQEMMLERDLARIPFVVIAINMPPELEDHTQSYGALRFLLFPLTADDVQRTVEEMLLAHGNWRVPRGFRRDRYDRVRTLDETSFMIGRQRVQVARPDR